MTLDLKTMIYETADMDTAQKKLGFASSSLMYRN